MQTTRLKRLVDEYLNNSISAEDCTELLKYLNSADPAELDGLIDIDLSDLDKGPQFAGQQSQDLLSRIKADPRFIGDTPEEKTGQALIVKFYHRRMVQVAAAILVLFGSALFVINDFNKRQTGTFNTVAKARPAIIKPGGNNAVLTVSGGKSIVLDSAANGLVATTTVGKIVKKQNGQIVYDAEAGRSAVAANVEYNTLTTPRGGEYQLVLPDGTKVWLDAASSITYPVAFTGNSRRVKLTGQGYFEVSKNKEKPFYVDVNHAEVKVLGTHFNISAYDDDGENVTTLLEGKVQLTKNGKTALLTPGQQAVIRTGSDNIAVQQADIDNVMAWKNGYFIFNDDDIQGIMRKVSRWYDVDVNYETDFSTKHFGGTFYRTKGISELLGHLEKIGKLHFKVSGRRITVMD